MNEAIAYLLEEHRAARRVLDTARRALAPFDPVRLKRALLFLKYMMDRVHHAEEEDGLFAALLEHASGSDRTQVEEMMAQHGKGHAHLKTAEHLLGEVEAGSETAGAALAGAVADYVDFTLRHMRFEEQAVFPLAERVLPGSQSAQLLEQFARTRALLISARDYQLYLDFAQDPGRVETMVAGPAPQPPEDAATRVIQSGRILHSTGAHRTVLFAQPHKGGATLNHYLVIDGPSGILIHPGSRAHHPQLKAGVQQHLENGRLDYLFTTGVDLDPAGLSSWLMDTDADLLTAASELPSLLGLESERCHPVPEEGGILALGRSDLAILPAPFLPDPRGHQLYDPLSKTLYTGELASTSHGPAQLSDGLGEHAAVIKEEHQRRVPSQAAVQAWLRMVRGLDVRIVAPRRGPIYLGEGVVAELWALLEATPGGADRLRERLELPTRPFAPGAKPNAG